MVKHYYNKEVVWQDNIGTDCENNKLLLKTNEVNRSVSKSPPA